MDTAHGVNMDIKTAVQIVANDQKDSDVVSVGDAIEYVLNTMRLPEDPAVPGSWAVEGDDENAEAYKTILRAADRTVPLMVAADILATEAGAEFLAEYARGQQP